MKKNLGTGQLKALSCAFFIGAGLLAAFFPALASGEVIETFDGYSLGPLSGQGDWYEGNNSIVVSDDFLSQTAKGTTTYPSTAGEPAQINIATSTKVYLKLFLYFNPWDTHAFSQIGIHGDSNSFDARFYGNSDTINMVGVIQTGSICSIPTGSWFKFEMVADVSDPADIWAIYNCNNAGWSEETNIGLSPNSRYFKNFLMTNVGNSMDPGDGSLMYIDDLQMSGTSCAGWKNRNDCIDGGCYWENIIFHEELSYCRPLATEEEGFCEYSVFGCAYCNSSTTCAVASGCFWNSIQGCSYLENVCEFDHLENCEDQTDCENASGTWSGGFCSASSMAPEDCSLRSNPLDRMVCEIKNFISSAFLPSKEKLSELGNTINLINTKFPSNYLRATKLFFDDIKNGINESTGIPVKILGREQNVSFGILNATGTAGAVSTIGNIFKTFFSLILIGVFIAWTINFLQRIFK